VSDQKRRFLPALSRDAPARRQPHRPPRAFKGLGF
jgi:hypothetical protein